MSDINDILSDLLENLPSDDFIDVEVPTKCLAYKSKTISIKPITYEDEKAVINASKAGGDAVGTLLSRCIKGIDPSELYEIDRIFLIIKLRDISFGNEYSVKVPCDSCKYDNDLVFKMDQLNTTFVPDDWVPTKDILLPVLKKTVTIRYPQAKDEEYTVDLSKTQDNLWRFIIKVEGHDRKEVISKFCEKLPIADRHSILNALSPKYGIDHIVKFQCQKCSHMNVIGLPLGADFLTVTS